MTANLIFEIDPNTCPNKAKRLAEIWDEVVSLIIQEMLTRAEPMMKSIHVNLREELALELAKLSYFLSQKVVLDRTNGRVIKNIDTDVESKQCFGPEGMAKISTTAENITNQIWLKKYAERWKPKTEAALRKEKGKKRTSIVPKPVERNHFIPKSFIKRYWAEGSVVFRTRKAPARLTEKQKTSVGSWGYRPNLYSDQLEAYFSLLEGDAVRPIQMLLNVEPLNRPQREALVGFIVIQRLRNPFFIKELMNTMAPVVSFEVGPDKSEDKQYMQAVYETLYSQDDLYDRLARPIMYSRWVVVRSENSDFVLPDVCNLFGSYENRQYVVMPLTPNDCLIVLPTEMEEPRVVPHYVKAPQSLCRDISYVLRYAAKEEFLSASSALPPTSNEEPNEILERIISSLLNLTAEQ